MKTDLVVGSRGQFDVQVDGETVATRKRSFLSHFIGGGWPSATDVVAAIRAKRSA